VSGFDFRVVIVEFLTMSEIRGVMVFATLVISIFNLVDLYKINRWIEKNNMDLK